MNSLRGMERFLSDKSLRRLFVARCLGGWEHPDAWMFASYSTVHIDWRWEMLELAFKKLIPLMKTLVANFSVEKLSTKTDDGKFDAQTIKDANRFISMQFVLPFSEMVRAMGEIINRSAHRLEACECHPHLWLAKTSRKRKQELDNFNWEHVFRIVIFIS